MRPPHDSRLAAVPDPPELAGDFHLRWIVALVNLEPSIRPTISLSVGGVIYSGTMISRRQFAERMRDEVASLDADPRAVELLLEPFDAILDAEDEREPTGTPTGVEMLAEVQRAGYVHLEHFTAWQADWPSVAEGTPPWRGLVEKVDGWSLAHLPIPHRAE